VDWRCASVEPRRGTGLVGVTGIAIGTPMRLVAPCGAIVPAPSAQGRVAAAPVGLALRASQRPVNPGAADLRRAIAAALLGLAAVGLAALAALRFRTAIAARGTHEATLEGRAPDDPAVGPRLALVRLPNERGP
jgi:hypothetical protein